jgi:HupE/UreJ protein
VLRGDRTIITPRVFAVLVPAMVITLSFAVAAHDIPNDVTVQMFVKPEGERLRLLVRAPLRACRDVDFPKRGPGYLDLARADDSLRDAATMWLSDAIQIYEGDRRLTNPSVVETRVSLESDRSFTSYEEALAHVKGAKIPVETDLYWNQALLDVLFEYPINSDTADYSIQPGFARLGLRVITVARFLPPGGVVRAFEFTGDPGLVRLDPRWSQAALRFVVAGFFHILEGADHLLFLLLLVIPFRRMRPLVVIVTAFTLAHSITLIASAYNIGPDALWFPPLIETLIALSIVYMGLENIVSSAFAPPALRPDHAEGRASKPASGGGPKLERRWMVTFGFGLVHGFGFSFALREQLQFAGAHLLTSLLAFNVGVELGQLLVLVVAIPVLAFVFRFVVAERIGTIILSALVVHTAWHWLTDRFDRLRQYRFEWPAFDAVFMLGLVRWLMLLVTVVAFGWLVFGVFKPSRHRDVNV